MKIQLTTLSKVREKQEAAIKADMEVLESIVKDCN